MQHHTRPTRIVLVGNEGEGDALQHLFCNAKDFHYVLCHARHINEILSLSSENEFDVILLHATNDATALHWLERLCEAFSCVPVVLLTEADNDLFRQRALRIGAHDVIRKTFFDFAALLRSMPMAAERRADEQIRRRAQSLEETYHFLQQHPVVSRSAVAFESFGMKPLSEAMPYKFIELTKSYSNVLELAYRRHMNAGSRFSGHSVSQKLHFLASDLGALKAGVWDVIDIHAKAMEQRSSAKPQEKEEPREILLELVSDLVSFYRGSDYANA